MPLVRVCCCGPGGQEISIDCCTAGGQQQRRPDAGSATSSADVGSRTQTCSVANEQLRQFYAAFRKHADKTKMIIFIHQISENRWQ